MSLSVIATLIVVSAGSPALAQIQEQWHLGFLHVAQAQVISKGATVTVAVLDTGVDAAHPDLNGSVLPGADFVVPPHSANGQTDFSGHGTAMAGLIAGHGGVTGIAPEARILPVRVFSDSESNSVAVAMTKGVDWAVEHGASIINVSGGDALGSPEEEAAIDRALARNIVIVAAAGNRPEDIAIRFPAQYRGVVAVVGVGHSGEHAAVSVTGPDAALAAPAVDIVSTDIGPRGAPAYSVGVGTSGAAAIVSGVAALVRSKFPKLSAAEVVHRLEATADDKGPPGRDDDYGYGIVDPVKALTADVPPLTASASPTATVATGTGDGGGSGSGRSLVVLGLVGAVVVIGAAWVVFGRRRAE